MICCVIVIWIGVIGINFSFIFLFSKVSGVIISDYFNILVVCVIVNIRFVGVFVDGDIIFSFSKFWFVIIIVIIKYVGKCLI